MSALETICVADVPGFTEGDAVTVARSRLRIRGIDPAHGFRPRVERLGLSNEAVRFWQVSFLVER